MKTFSKFVMSIVMCELVGLISTPFTISAIPTWYAYLHKPFFSPPNWVFGPVWTILYFLMGIAAFLVWQEGIQKMKVKKAIGYFILQLFFNFLWSALFFGLHNPLLGLVDIVLLLISITVTMIAFYRISRPASYLLLPYLLWVSFATLLTTAIMWLNR